MLSASLLLTTVPNYFRFREIEAFSGSMSETLLLTEVSMGFSISSSSEDNVASAILFTYSPQANPTSFPGLFPSRGGRPPRKGKSPGNDFAATQSPKPNSCN